MPESNQPTTTERVQATEAREEWSELLNSVVEGRTRVILERSGIAIAAIVSTKDLETLEQAEKDRMELRTALDELRQGFKGVPAKEIEQEVGMAIAEVRRESQQERRGNQQAPGT